MVIFLYGPHIFVWIRHGHISNTDSALISSSSVIKRLDATVDLPKPLGNV